MHAADDLPGRPSNVISLADKKLCVRALIGDIDKLLEGEIEGAGANIVSLCAYRRSISQHTLSEDLSRYTITYLGPRIGHRYALLLHLMGFRLLDDLANAHPTSIASIPGIGERRLQMISAVLAEQTLASRTSSGSMLRAEPINQLEFDLS